MPKSIWTVSTAADVAAHFDLAPRTIEAWLGRGCPGAPGHFDLRKIGRWLASTRMQRLKVDDQSEGENSPALEEKRRVETELRKLDLSERRGELVNVAEFLGLMERFGGLIRVAGERLGRTHGPDAQDVLLAALDDAEAMLASVGKEIESDD